MNLVKTIGMKPVKDFVKYVIYTGFVKNKPYPVSAMIIAPPEHAKSTVVEKFECLGVMQVDKATAYGLADILNNMTEKERKIYHHFVILDLENYASMGRVVKEQFIAFVKQTTQEGMKKYHTAKIHLDLESRISYGFIMCTTPEDIGDKRSMFRSLAFLSRVVPFTYKYSDDMRREILNFVTEEEHNEKQRYIMDREEKKTITLPRKYADQLNILALVLAKRIENVSAHRKTIFTQSGNVDELCGIRAKEELATLLKAIALYNGRDVVVQEDFDELRRLYKWMNFKFYDIDKQHEDD